MAFGWQRNDVDMIWSLLNDGRWYTRKSIVKMLPLGCSDISEALDFLVKYGFAITGVSKLRVPLNSPSPKEIFELLYCFEESGASP